jgi:hypothetical protein
MNEEKKKKGKIIRKEKNKNEKNKNAPQLLFAFIEILESFEDKPILNLFQPCVI